jgi:hypothetical protein
MHRKTMKMRTARSSRDLATVALGVIAQASTTSASGQAAAPPTLSQQAGTMKSRIDIEGATMTGRLEDNATARDFASLLPLTVTLADYAGTEKISDLPRRLSTEGAPAGSDPAIGDIAYYAPWGNLAIFYRDFRYSGGLMELGALESGAAAISRPDAFRATIELVAD